MSTPFTIDEHVNIHLIYIEQCLSGSINSNQYVY